MSESIRRSSSRQLLQNLIKVTAQRSLEDAEEVERERRRRARHRQREEPSASFDPQQQNNLTLTTQSNEEVKPSCCLVVDEDEGFSDWSHRLDNRNDCEHFRVKEQAPSWMQWKAGRFQENEVAEQMNESLQSTGSSPVGEREVKASDSSTVFLSQDARQPDIQQPADKTPHMATGRMRPDDDVCTVDRATKQEEEEVQWISQRKWRSDQSRPTYEDEPEEDELNLTHEKEEGRENPKLQRSREEQYGKDEDRNVRSAFSVCSSEEEDAFNCYGPMSPTFKKLLIQFYPEEVTSRVPTDGKCVITERTESLRKSANFMKKTSPPMCVSKIDRRLQQYTHALEISSKEGRAASQVPVDLTSPALPVAHKRNMFEAGEAWNYNSLTNTPSKDADTLKVGVSELINQWLRGGESGSGSSSLSKPAEIQLGGVLVKKNMWESFGDVVSPGWNGKECTTAKKHTCVVTSHGEYEKVSDEDGCRDTNWSA
ncbi:caldesmon-like isoform X2 [Dunckerocampus dactyliophorus]|uniref:caldesmon-like isoform X2 n=1 Tax=Dunckerocampus dactyliophorus TaxID=161453 RepID=UPI00240540DA|nr:caldesmon-like isoform X2 [Dunckerocampus dactyliophorus]